VSLSSSQPTGHPLQRVVIATRESALALWQARHIASRLSELYPGITVELLGMTTEGDRRLGVSLSAIGGKGLFVKELEDALARGDADLAVHSLKDVPMALPDGFVLGVITERADPRDAFVSTRYRTLDDMPDGARVGTSSLRRQSLIRARYPGLVIDPLRGNVPTRLRKLDEGGYDAIILAAAGLKRLGLGDRITALLDPAVSLPAVGQGALGIECRTDRADVLELLKPLHDAETAACVFAERALSRALAGSCNVPLGGYATVSGDRLTIDGFVGMPDGSRTVRHQTAGDKSAPESVGLELARVLKSMGADDILSTLEQGGA
jgi:hydroxymethylbilane synthase